MEILVFNKKELWFTNSVNLPGLTWTPAELGPVEEVEEAAIDRLPRGRVGFSRRAQSNPSRSDRVIDRVIDHSHQSIVFAE